MAAAVPRRATLRVAVWGFHLVLPLLGLWLLLAQPHFDVVIEHHVGHFALVVAVAAVNVALGVRMSEVSRNRGDARLFLVSLVFLSSAGFLLLHALATPQVILYGRNAGFAIATPVGLLLAAVFAALSSLNLTPERAEAVLRRQALLRGGLAAVMVAWGVVSLFGLPPLDTPLPEEASRGPLTAMAIAGVALYLVAAVRYWLLYRRRPSVILIAILTAFALLAEAMVAVALARNWHASWWEWHLLMAFAFAFVYYSAHVQYAREGSWSSLFRGIYLQETIQQVRREHGAALEALVEAMQQPDGARPVGRVVADLADRFDLTEGQAQVLERAAEALLAEREQISRLRALVAVGAEARVIVDERHLLERGSS
jgi:adenylate cyclase